MKTVAIIGAGISGLSAAQCLKDRFNVKVFERESRPGGLIRCARAGGHLYHQVGGHVFNSKRQDVLDWFWTFFNQKREFVPATRHAVIAMPDSKIVGYPIENHIYMLDPPTIRNIIKDLMNLSRHTVQPVNFEEFLKARFGATLFDIYFAPYNRKIWQTDLKNIPLTWLEGKLPMPSVEDIMFSNFCRQQEDRMVHSAFWYARAGGSQFIADRLAENLNISYNSPVNAIRQKDKLWTVNGELFDSVVFCGNLKELPAMMGDTFPIPFRESVQKLNYHGTTTVLCEIQPNPYSWIYLPDEKYKSHRIICTGNFASSNNAPGKMSATIEFTGEQSKQEIDRQLDHIPLSPEYVAHQYTPCTYPVQSSDTRKTVQDIKQALEKENFYLTGRFAEWEYYNMDAAAGASIDLAERIVRQ